jgi:hypothetical protein
MDISETEWEGVGWMHLAQDRDQWRAVVNTVMNLWFPQKEGNFLIRRVIVSFSKKLFPGVSNRHRDDT